MIKAKQIITFRNVFGITLALGTVVACTKGGGSASSSTNAVDALSLAKSMYDQSTTVCNGLDPSNSAALVGESFGLAGQLYAMAPADQNKYTAVSDYISHGINTGTNVFLNSVNVPTRDFYEGFPSATGSLLTYQGSPLLEWFALDLQSSIQLAPGDAQGDYQFALLADDGAIFSIYDAPTGTMKPLVNDDGEHPTYMKCATSTVTINSYDLIPIRLQYYQGPRYQIALQLMWRKIPTGGSLSDPLCDTSGNYQFFNPDVQPSAPTQNYQNLLARGWKPLAPQNFIVPGGLNPCQVPSFNSAQ